MRPSGVEGQTPKRVCHPPFFRLPADPKAVRESMNRLMFTMVVSVKRSLRSLKAQNYSEF